MGHFGDDARHGQQVDVAADRCALVVRGDSSGVAGREVEHAEHAHEIAARRVLGEVVPPRVDDAGMHGADGAEIPGLGVRLDRLRHAADEVIQTQELQQAPVNDRVRRREVVARRPLERLDLPGEPLLTDRPQELGEGHRTQIEVFDASDRHGEGVVRQHELHRRTGGDDRQLRHLFQEVAEGDESAGGGLYLVQEQHRALGP